MPYFTICATELWPLLYTTYTRAGEYYDRAHQMQCALPYLGSSTGAQQVWQGGSTVYLFNRIYGWLEWQGVVRASFTVANRVKVGRVQRRPAIPPTNLLPPTRPPADMATR